MKIGEAIQFMFIGLDPNEVGLGSSNIDNSERQIDTFSGENRKRVFFARKRSETESETRKNVSKISDGVIITISICCALIILALIFVLLYVSVAKIEVPCFVENIVVGFFGGAGSMMIGICATLMRVPKEFFNSRN
jgi:predicted signal transduction protein with EAL and GGDEF domain